MSQGLRFKFAGSKFAVQTALGTPKTITDITQANPAVVTATAHGFLLGDIVKLLHLKGMTQLEGDISPVAAPLTNTFALAGIDSTNYPDLIVDSSNAASVSKVVLSDFCELTGVNQQDGSADQIEVTTICSTAKEFEVGLGDSGTISLDYNYAPNAPVQAALRAAKLTGAAVAMLLVLPNGGGSILIVGYVQQTSFRGQTNGVYTGSATVKLTGEIQVLAA